MTVADVPDVPPSRAYARGLALFYPPKKIGGLPLTVGGEAISWAEYQMLVRNINEGLVVGSGGSLRFNQMRWQAQIRRAELSTQIERSVVVLVDAQAEHQLTYQAVAYETPFRRT